MALATDVRQELGTNKMPNEIRFHCPNLYNQCRDETRTHEIKFWADFSYPDNQTIVAHLSECTVTAALTGLLTAESTFVPAFQACMTFRMNTDLVKQISIDVHSEHIYGKWRTH